MRNKLINLLLASTIVLSSIMHATDIDDKYRKGYDLVAASINTAAKENSISFYRNNQIILLKPDPKGRNNKPVPFTSTIKENGDLGKPKLSKELSKLGISGTVAFDSVAGKMYFSKYNSVEKDYALYESAVKKGKWQDPVQMKIEGTGGQRKQNSFMTSAGWSYKTVGLSGFKNPSISKNGKRIYFTAKIRPKEYGNVGGTDIWYIDQREDGTWSRPINAGKGINTSAKEDYAFCVGDTLLYFSSMGKGGIDIFKSKLINGQWAKGVNLNKPYSSSLNDFNFIANDKFIYLVSTRNMKGKDDIYLFRKQPDPVVIPPPVAIPPEPEPDPVVEVKQNWNFVLFYFDFDKDILTDEFTRQFKELVEEMKQFPGETFEVAGHTDQRGSDKYNQKLSEHRANFVKQLLVKEGFPADKIIAKGFGKKMPVVEDPKSEDDYAQNRRCEIRIISQEVKNPSSTDINKAATPTEVVAPENAAPADTAPAKDQAVSKNTTNVKPQENNTAKDTKKQGATDTNVKTNKSTAPAKVGVAKKTK
ncbi:MAG: OmpA family protein [Paludibacteraceae bacterium]|nr:OmpA family protein [Paludibacteraceae bacterium]